jgi:hypothetical protein
MSRGDWLPYFALRGCLIAVILLGFVSLALSQGAEQPDPPDAQADQSQPAQETPATDPTVASEPPASADRDTKPCDNPQTREERDLCQQWRMAEGTEQLAALAARQNEIANRQFWGTAFEIGLIIIAIFVAGWAAIQARNAVIATKETADFTREIGQRQLRAYVVFGSSIWTEVKQPKTGKTLGYSVAIIWRNSGMTPARRCRTRVSAGDAKDDLPKDFAFSDKPLGASPQTEKSHIGPNGEARNVVGFTLDKVQAAQRREIKLLVWGWIEYDDIFEDTPRRRTEICFQIDVGADMKSTLTTIGPFNGADEDCHHQPKT